MPTLNPAQSAGWGGSTTSPAGLATFTRPARKSASSASLRRAQRLGLVVAGGQLRDRTAISRRADSSGASHRLATTVRAPAEMKARVNPATPSPVMRPRPESARAQHDQVRADVQVVDLGGGEATVGVAGRRGRPIAAKCEKRAGDVVRLARPHARRRARRARRPAPRETRARRRRPRPAGARRRRAPRPRRPRSPRGAGQRRQLRRASPAAAADRRRAAIRSPRLIGTRRASASTAPDGTSCSA